jgi:DNA-binding response OmpR family regulator
MRQAVFPWKLMFGEHMARSILIIEDDLEFADFVMTGLTEEGFAVEHAVDGRQGCEMLQSRPWDLVLLDWSLPHQDGLSLLRGFRQSGREAPVIFLTARDEVDDRVTGLDSGADDYLCKPFAFAELLARVRALVRRREQPASFCLVYRDVNVDPIAQRAQRAGRSLNLTGKELAILSYFLSRPGRILTRKQIYENVWDESVDTTSNTFEVHLKELRRKLEALGPRLIHNRRGRGYFLGESPLRERP